MVASRALLMAAFLAIVNAAVESGGGGVDVPIRNDRKIIGGDKIPIDTVPWQVLMLEDGKPHCGGAIISQKWVLTAAHCLGEYWRHYYHIRVGSSYKFSGGNLYTVGKVALHSQYDPITVRNDIAALQTTSPIQFGEKARPAKLPGLGSRRVPVGSMLRLSGWGFVTWGEHSPWLMATDIPLVYPSVCDTHLQYYHQESQLCAGTSTMKACAGDSGGPLVRGDVLVGIVSYGSKECVTPVSAFTDVTLYREWIKSNTGV